MAEDVKRHVVYFKQILIVEPISLTDRHAMETLKVIMILRMSQISSLSS